MPSSKRVEYEKRRDTSSVPTRRTAEPQQKATFINLELTQAEKETLQNFAVDATEFDGMWEEMLDDGYKITCKYDTYTNCYAAFAFPDDTAANSGYILTGRGRHPTRALRQLFYKHFVVLEKDWLGAQGSAVNRGDSDW